MSEEKVAVVVGVGPGLGTAVARRFAREGYAIALLARGEERLAPAESAIDARGGRSLAFAADATDPDSLHAAFAAVRQKLGEPEVFVYNAGAYQPGGILEISPDDFERAWKANCLGGFLGAREVLPSMIDRGRGTILFTGATASLRGSARFAALAVGKFGLRALAQSMARELGPKGIHVAHVVVDGQIDSPKARLYAPERDARAFLSPDAIAESYWQLHAQHPTAWTLELDLRPAVEKF